MYLDLDFKNRTGGIESYVNEFNISMWLLYVYQIDVNNGVILILTAFQHIEKHIYAN